MADAMGLETYRRKRNFERTPEPDGGSSDRSRGSDLVFVVQKHDASHLHYDFRLELDGVLKSWAVPKGPVPDPGVKRLAMQVEDHPLGYGDFEGVIPKGEYGGGTVMLWDRGTWEPIGDAGKGLRKGRLEFELHGDKLQGRWMLIRSDSGDGGNSKAKWLLFKRSDAAARPGSGDALLDERSLSVSTGRSMKEIAGDRGRVWSSKKKGGGRKARRRRPSVDAAEVAGAKAASRMPTSAGPQLATLVQQAPEGDDWLHEIKFDGYRLLCRISDGDVALVTRGGQDWADRLRRIATAAASLGVEQAIIDGEAVVLDAEGRSDFQALQNAMDARGRGDLYFYAFDLLHLNGVDLRGVALEDRKEVLRQLLENAPAVIRYSDHVRGGGPEFHENACRMHLEGIISKRASALYRSGRSRDWLKTKCLRRQEFVIIGWTEPSGSREALGSLVLAVHDEAGELRYAGRVGTGFDNRTLRGLLERLLPLEHDTATARGTPRSARGGRGIHWVEPELVAEVAFTEWTSDGVVRHPSFQGLREDKPAAEVVREAAEPAQAPKQPKKRKSAKPKRANRKAAVKKTQAKTHPNAPSASARKTGRTDPVEVAGVRISNPDKVLWPEQGVTKRELAEYWEAVAEYALPYIEQRPLTLLRCPSGVEGSCFYQKHANSQVPDVIPRVPVEEHGGSKSELYMLVDGLTPLIALVQLGVLEFHVWGARADRLDRPDLIVMDVDPAPDVDWSEVVEAALVLRNVLAELGIQSWPRATGGKGLHVVAPLVRRTGWDDLRAFTRRLAELIAAAAPDRFLAKASKQARAGRIYIDYLRNVRNATAIATLSPRAREGAPVALPLSWADVTDSAEPIRMTVREVPAILEHMAREPWAGFADVRQSITKQALDAVGA